LASRKTPSKGAKPDKIWSDALRRAVMRRSDSDKGRKRIEVMADKCARMAETGVPARRQIEAPIIDIEPDSPPVLADV